MKFKKILIAIMLFSIVIISGCKGGNNQQTVATNPYVGGSQGLVASFEDMGIVDQSGAQSIFDSEKFPVTITLRNKGEYKIPTNTVKTTIKGIAPSDYTGLTFAVTGSQEIESISLTNTKGGEVTIEHAREAQLAQNIIKDRNAITATIYADVVYPYKTFVVAPQVCFKDSSSTTTRNEICEVENSNLQVYSSGAPIRAVSAKEQRAGTGIVSVEFTIENVGGGKSKAKSKTDFDYRYNDITYDYPTGWTCRSSGADSKVARFGDDNKLTIICKLNTAVAKNEVYQKALDITLDYDYKSIISTNLIIKNKNI